MLLSDLRDRPSAALPLAEPAASRYRVGGVVPFSAIDWPGRLVAVVFAQGCAWRCGYCHNPHLVPVEGEDERDFSRVLGWLGTRRGLIDGVVFSGGEPTAQPALGSAVAQVRDLGFAVALHTAGIYPRRLAAIARRLDWIGFDVKAPRAAYESVTGVPRSGVAAFVSLSIVLESGVPCEIRTTVHSGLTPAEALRQLAKELAGAGVTRWVLQPFRAAGCGNEVLVRQTGLRPALDEALLAELRAILPGTLVRA